MHSGILWASSVVVVSLAVLGACGSDDGGGKSSSGGAATGGSDGGGTGGGGTSGAGDAADGGPTLAAVCVKAPVAAPWPGDATCPVAKPGVADALDEALTRAKTDRCKYGFSDQTMAIWKPIFADDKYQLPIFRPLHLGLLRLPGYAKETESWLDAALDGEHAISDAIEVAAARAGTSSDTCGKLDEFEAAAQDSAPLAAAIAKLIDLNGGSSDLPGLQIQTKDVPLELQKALVPVIAAIHWGAGEYKAALGTDNLDEIDWLEQVHAMVILPTVAFKVDKTSVAYLAKVDGKRIAGAAAVVARAVEDAKLEAFAGEQVPPVAIDTPLGAIVLGGPGNDSYGAGHLAERSALLLDTGGDDTYKVPVGAGRRDVPVGLAIDLGGKDVYGYDAVSSPLDKPTRPPADEKGRSVQFGALGQTLSRIGRQGSGVLGIGLLWDLGTEGDEYHSLALSQGAGSLGVGVLFDAGGDDQYVAESTSQGSGMFGIGILLDRAGKDSYKTFYASQGFGYVRGVGILAEGGGDDTFFADPGDPQVGGDSLYPSAQLPGEGNTSMSQGAGFGRRDDATQINMGGGHGVLYDRAGSDHYTASVFAQGAGYWLGFGLLDDKAGNDTYEGLWYVQGAAAHFALGFFYEHAGDDVYDKGFPIRATSIGVGHDFSGALHIDEGGNDDYTAPGLSLGCGNSQGAGGLINLGGDDKYAPAGSATYGCASIGHDPPFDTTRDVRPTLGIFVDANGTEVYAVPSGAPAAADGASWSYGVYAKTPGAPPSEQSGGVDRSPGAVTIP
jgi:hypothetical protein